uniref:Uncharacterized protein n=1 Tax=Steinernema glaseri TaxID=37863 RepID=A0A1I7ZH72_9BILA
MARRHHRGDARRDLQPKETLRRLPLRASRDPEQETQPAELLGLLFRGYRNPGRPRSRRQPEVPPCTGGGRVFGLGHLGDRPPSLRVVA